MSHADCHGWERKAVGSPLPHPSSSVSGRWLHPTAGWVPPSALLDEEAGASPYVIFQLPSLLSCPPEASYGGERFSFSPVHPSSLMALEIFWRKGFQAAASRVTSSSGE